MLRLPLSRLLASRRVVSFPCPVLTLQTSELRVPALPGIFYSTVLNNHRLEWCYFEGYFVWDYLSSLISLTHPGIWGIWLQPGKPSSGPDAHRGEVAKWLSWTSVLDEVFEAYLTANLTIMMITDRLKCIGFFFTICTLPLRLRGLRLVLHQNAFPAWRSLSRSSALKLRE